MQSPQEVPRPYNVLVLCTGNSARSILAEVLINELARGALHANSAGSHPAGRVNPGAIDKLTREGHAIDGLESKTWDRFSAEDAPRIDIVITVCDNAAGESCPIWNGSPITVHWGIPDPAIENAGDAETRAAFDRAYEQLRTRIEAMLDLPFEELSADELAAELERVHLSGCRAPG
jgi:arsenate reductase